MNFKDEVVFMVRELCLTKQNQTFIFRCRIGDEGFLAEAIRDQVHTGLLDELDMSVLTVQLQQSPLIREPRVESGALISER